MISVKEQANNSSINTEQLFEKAEHIAGFLYETAADRDTKGGTPFEQRKTIRESGLLKLLIPKELGGYGSSWSEIYKIIRTFAQADSSLAHVFAFQFLMLASIRLYGSSDQWQILFAETAEKNLWWGNALNPLDNRTITTRQGNQLIFNGFKSFCSGATDSDRLIVSAIEAETNQFIVAAVPTSRTGIHIHNDWDNIGQRQTDSGTVEFKGLIVEHNELLMNPGPLSSPFSSLRSLIAQLIFTNIYLGITEGALQEAVKYTRSSSRVWSASLAKTIHEDPYILLHYGEFYASVAGVRLLVEQAASLLDKAWQKGLTLTDAERGEVALAVFSAKVNSTKVGLDVTSRIFEVSGARATTAKLRIDRFWRNLRVYTLHDPVDYKLKDLGDWVLNGNYPAHSFYT